MLFVITGYDQDDDLSSDEEFAPDFYDDLWTFDASADGTINLVIDFSRSERGLLAEIYDDQSGDAQVSIDFDGGRPTVAESPYPAVRVISPDGWWQDEEIINFNINVEVDGPVDAAFSAVDYLDISKHDGTADFQISVYDPDNDGKPDYELRNFLFDGPILKSNITINQFDNEPTSNDFLFWPYLGGNDYGGMVRSGYGFAEAPIQVDWETGRIAVLAEIVASRTNDNNCFIYSTAPINKGITNYANFENPFCLYDLAMDTDSYPEMAIRMEYWGPGDERIHYGYANTPLNNIRYSWDQDNDRSWDYKIGLAGRRPIDAIKEFSDFAVQTIPHDEFPYWATEYPWDAIQFVHVEGSERYWTSEGIYQWGIDRSLWLEYMLGRVEIPEFHSYESIGPGLRGEYSMFREGGLQPRLYFSPVDSKLHLLGAQKGLWNIDDKEKLVYENADQDLYIDRWSHYIGEEVDKSLIFSSPFLIYIDRHQHQVKVVESETPFSLFETRPPRNHQEWLELAGSLETHGSDIESTDFSELFDRFNGAKIEISGVAFRDFRHTDDGFRFVLEPRPAIRVDQAADAYLSALEDAEQAYVVVYDGRLSARPLVPASLRVDISDVASTLSQVNALEITRFTVPVYNLGQEDAYNIDLAAHFRKRGGQTVIATTTVALVPAEGSAEAQFEWTPRSGGVWDLVVAINGDVSSDEQVGYGSYDSPDRSSINVLPAQSISWQSLLQLDAGPSFSWLIGVLLLATIIAALSVALLVMRERDGAIEESV
jgi:hypothetical protein